MNFELEDFSPVKLNSANFRSQLHGEEHVPAVDLSFTMDAPLDAMKRAHGVEASKA